jgi:hypothetical protein
MAVDCADIGSAIMKQLVVLAGCAILLLVFVGCRHTNTHVDRVIDDNERFPGFLVGVWEVHEPDWGFMFEPDGSISKMVHFIAGEVNLKEGGTYVEGPDPGTYALFIMGPCEAEYEASTRELRVKIILDYYKMVLPEGELEGKSHDYFRGPVSKDGKTWTVEWRSYTWLEGGAPPPTEEIDVNPEQLVFTKIDITSLKGG